MRWHSHTLFDELLRVPLLIRYPGGRHAGLSVSRQVRLLDVAPTILGMAGVPAPGGFEGVDLELVIDGLAPPLPAFSQLDRLAGEKALSIRTLNWKLYPRVALAGMRFFDEKPSLITCIAKRFQRWRQPFALFDLENDPAELDDVAGDHFSTATELRKIAERLIAERPAPPPPPVPR